MAGVYVHIPFCKQRCAYCDFYSTTAHRLHETYVQAVLSEARNRRHELPTSQSIDTLYIGGGTPSVLMPEVLTALVQGLQQAMPLDHVSEFTIEVNPDDVTRQIDRAPTLGVNRVSMGVQSFVDSELRLIGRRHNARQGRQAVEHLRRMGVDNISIDLIYGLPGQTVDSWLLSLDEAIGLDVEHISAYNLSYEQGTPLWRMRQQGAIVEVDDDTCVEMFRMLVSRLKAAGYEHYEISNFAKPGRHSRHNSSYWDGTPYLGLGAAAHSFDGHTRRHNPSDLDAYIAKVNQRGLAFDEEQLTFGQQYDEMVMLSLRTARGLDTGIVHHRFGQDIYDHLMRQAQPHLASGMLDAHAGQLRLTDSGIMISDTIISDLFL